MIKNCDDFISSLRKEDKHKALVHFNDIYECKDLEDREYKLIYLAYLWGCNMVEVEGGIGSLKEGFDYGVVDHIDYELQEEQEYSGGMNLLSTYEYFDLEKLDKKLNYFGRYILIEHDLKVSFLTKSYNAELFGALKEEVFHFIVRNQWRDSKNILEIDDYFIPLEVLRSRYQDFKDEGDGEESLEGGRILIQFYKPLKLYPVGEDDLFHKEVHLTVTFEGRSFDLVLSQHEFGKYLEEK